MQPGIGPSSLSPFNGDGPAHHVGAKESETMIMMPLHPAVSLIRSRKLVEQLRDSIVSNEQITSSERYGTSGTDFWTTQRRVYGR